MDEEKLKLIIGLELLEKSSHDWNVKKKSLQKTSDYIIDGLVRDSSDFDEESLGYLKLLNEASGILYTMSYHFIIKESLENLPPEYPQYIAKAIEIVQLMNSGISEKVKRNEEKAKEVFEVFSMEDIENLDEDNLDAIKVMWMHNIIKYSYFFLLGSRIYRQFLKQRSVAFSIFTEIAIACKRQSRFTH